MKMLRNFSTNLFLRSTVVPHPASGACILTYVSVTTYSVQFDWIRPMWRRLGSSHGYTSLLKVTSMKWFLHFTVNPSDVMSRGPKTEQNTYLNVEVLKSRPERKFSTLLCTSKLNPHTIIVFEEFELSVACNTHRFCQTRAAQNQQSWVLVWGRTKYVQASKIDADGKFGWLKRTGNFCGRIEHLRWRSVTSVRPRKHANTVKPPFLWSFIGGHVVLPNLREKGLFCY